MINHQADEQEDEAAKNCKAWAIYAHSRQRRQECWDRLIFIKGKPSQDSLDERSRKTGGDRNYS